MKKNFWKKPESITDVLEQFLQRLGKQDQAQLTRLWQHWDMVMGADIATLTWPLGSKNNTLHLGGEDTMSMQDITYMSDEIIERANAFLGREFFTSIKVHLSLDKTPLNIAAQARPIVRTDLQSAPVLTGEYLHTMPKDSVIAQCYALYVKKSQNMQESLSCSETKIP